MACAKGTLLASKVLPVHVNLFNMACNGIMKERKFSSRKENFSGNSVSLTDHVTLELPFFLRLKFPVANGTIAGDKCTREWSSVISGHLHVIFFHKSCLSASIPYFGSEKLHLNTTRIIIRTKKLIASSLTSYNRPT